MLSDPGFRGDWARVAESHRDLLRALEGDDPQRAAELFRLHAGGNLGLAETTSSDDRAHGAS